MGKRIFKYLLIFVVVIFLLMVLVWVALQNATVQSKVADYFTNRLSKQYNTEITIGKVDIDFFKTIRINDVLVKDHQQDTLLYAGSLKSDISLFSLGSQKLHVDNVKLENAYINLYEKDGKPNYGFLQGSKVNIDNQTEPTNTNESWDIDLEHVDIKDSNIKYNFPDLIIDASVKDLSTELNDFSLDLDDISVKNIDLKDSDISIVQVPSTSGENSETPFPEIPFNIMVDDFTITDTRFELKEKGYKADAKQLDFKNLRLNLDEVNINQFLLSPTKIACDIRQIITNDDSGADLSSLKGKLDFTPQKLSFKNLDLRMPRSRIKGAVNLSYRKFQDLVDFDRSIHSNIRLSWAKVSVRDLKPLQALTSLDVSTINPSATLIANGSMSIKGNNDFTFSNVKAKLGKAASGKINGHLKLNESLGLSQIDLRVEEGFFSPLKTKELLPSVNLPLALVEQGDINFDAEIAGIIDDINITALAANTALGTHVNASGKVSGLYTDALKYDLNVNDFGMNLSKIASIDLPSQVKTLGYVDYKGQLKGDTKLFDIDGLLKTEQGNINADIVVQFNELYDDATYQGNVTLQQLNLRKITNDETFGIVDLNLDVNGQGLSMENLQTSVKGVVNDFTYKGKRYQNISVDGQIDGLGYKGKVNIKDKDLKLNYDGSFAYNDQAPILDFKMNMDSLDLASLNLGLGNYKITGHIESKLKGKDINDVTGSFLLNDFVIEKDGKKLSSKESIKLNITDNPNQTRTAIINSPYADATITGNIEYTEVANALANIFDAYFEIPGWKPEPIDGRYRFDMDFESKNLNPLLEFYNQDFRVKHATIDGKMDTDNQVLKFKGALDSLVYKDYWTERTTLDIDGENTEMIYSLRFDNVHDKSGIISEVSLVNGDIYDKILNLFVDLRKKKDAPVLEFGAQLSQQEDQVVINIGESLTINNDEWSISKDNDLVISNGTFSVDNLRIFKDKQGVLVSNEKDDIKVSFEDFQLMELLGLIGKDQFEYHGKINGDVFANDLMSNLYVTSNLSIDSLTFDDKTIGDLNIKADQSKNGKNIDVDFSLLGDENDGFGNISYAIDSKDIKGRIELGQLEMRLVDPFLAEVISDSQGHIYGDCVLKGNLDNIDASGKLWFDDASTVINFNQTRYKIKRNFIRYNKRIIELGDIYLLDDSDNKAVVSGAIFHNSFRDMLLNVNVTSEGVKFLNTTADDNPLFYGTVYLDADMQITGKTDNLKLYANATAVNNSHLALSPFSNVEESLKDDYIIYGNPDSIRLNSKVEDFIKEDAFPLDVDMNLIVNDDSKFEFIVDPIKGDKLQAFGDANLNLKLKKEGDILLYGKYLADRGFYSFTYGLIEKKFAIDKGGTVSFEGDPLAAKLDIDAIYKTKANLYDLVQSEINEEGIATRNRRSNVNVNLGLRGKILKPKISLGISLPDRNEPLYEAAEQKLASLRTNTNQLNNQVFGLLLFDNFVISSNEVSSPFSNVGEDFVLGSVSDLLSSQLNKIASGLIKGVELNVDVNNYASKYSQNAGVVTELDFGVTKRLLDDRLTLKAGGNFNIESNTAQSEFSSLAGDFVIEYILNDKGNYILKVYNSSDYNILIDQNTRKSGIGIILKKNLD